MQNKTVRIQCPAKINLKLKVLSRRPDGFHNIESIMQTINLFDYLTITIEKAVSNEINLSGNSEEIPYDENNLVYKAAILFLEENNISDCKIDIYIEKNIPVKAGLAGGSTDAAGTLYGLNKLFEDVMSESDLHRLCAKLGSDLNFCLKGGCVKTTGRGEILHPSDFRNLEINLIKPNSFGISAKEAYEKFSKSINDPEKLKTREKFLNDLEWAVIDDYPQLQTIKKKYPNSVMTGSGPAYFSLSEKFQANSGYWVKNELKAVPFGVKIVKIEP